MSIILKIFQKYSFLQTTILLMFFTIMMCLRAPDVFIYGRFWAEEGERFFPYAWNMPPLQALFYSFGGYLNLPVNASILIARWCVPLEYAPYFTTLIGMLFQILPLFLLLTSKEKWLSPFPVRLFIVLLLLFVPESAETSLQSLHIQFSLTLSCAIILFLTPNYSYQRWFKLVILALAGLSGLMNIALLPIYAIRCWLDKSKLRLEEFVVLLSFTSLEYFFFFEGLSLRSHSIAIKDFFDVFLVRVLYTPLFNTNLLTKTYLNYFQNTQITIFPFLIVTFFVMGIIWIFYKYPKTRSASFLFFSSLFIFSLSIIGAISGVQDFFLPFNNQRYVFIPQSLLCIMLIYITYHLPLQGRKIGQAIIIWLIIINSVFFFVQPAFLIRAPENCLPWRQQVKLWKKNPQYVFQIWPHWVKMTLPPK